MKPWVNKSLLTEILRLLIFTVALCSSWQVNDGMLGYVRNTMRATIQKRIRALEFGVIILRAEPSKPCIITSALTSQPMATTFSSAHRLYVKSLYKRYLTNALDWSINRDVWRWQAMQIRAEFEKNRCVVDSPTWSILFC